MPAGGPGVLEICSDADPFGAEDEEWLGTIMPNYAQLRAASIFGGSSEVQKTIVARTMLGLS